MSACTFFGHRNCREEVKAKLKKVLEELTVKRGVNQFYLGTTEILIFTFIRFYANLKKVSGNTVYGRSGIYTL